MDTSVLAFVNIDAMGLPLSQDTHMEFAACHVSIAPLRAEPSHRSEMTSQLLFGETVEVKGARGPWIQVVCNWDGYIGWVQSSHLKRITQQEYEAYVRDNAMSLSLVEGLMGADHIIPLPLGAVLPEFDGLRCRIGGKSYRFSGLTVTPGQVKPNGDWLIRVARKYLHAPYLWGGRSPFGIDCSGFVQMVYKSAGIRLMRDAHQQMAQGVVVDFTEQCQAGDLAFFDNHRGHIHHVGIVLPDCHIIHASGHVRIDKFDHFGIFNAEIGRYTHQLRIIKRLLDTESAQTPNANAKTLEKHSGTADQPVLFAL